MIATIDQVRDPRLGAPAISGVRDGPAHPGPTVPAGAPAFADELAAARSTTAIHFSKHAQRRLESRQIDFSEDETSRLRRAFDTLAQRGGRQSLVMLDRLALVVNVPSGTVLTALPADQGKEAVFTQIDSVVIA